MKIIEFLEINLRDKIFLESERIYELTDMSSLTCGAKPKSNWQVSLYQLILLKGRNITELVVHYNQDEHYDIEKIVATSLSRLQKFEIF